MCDMTGSWVSLLFCSNVSFVLGWAWIWIPKSDIANLVARFEISLEIPIVLNEKLLWLTTALWHCVKTETPNPVPLTRPRAADLFACSVRSRQTGDHPLIIDFVGPAPTICVIAMLQR